MGKLLVVCGSTATGKTQLGLELARKFNGEIVSADSRQAYKRMDIGTGKDLPVNSKFEARNSKLGIQKNTLQTGYYFFDGVPVWMLDVVEPNQQFSVAQYYELASKVIGKIWSRKKLPIVVGGTGLYIKALVDGIETINIPPDIKLRNTLRNKSPEELLEMLRGLDVNAAESLNESEKKNKQRLIRRIEIARWKWKVRSGNPVYSFPSPTSVIFIGITAPREVLYERIDQRVDVRMRQGMVEELKRLLREGVLHDRLQTMGLEYRAIDNYLLGKISKEVMVQQLKYDIHAYARRQLTWFKKDKRVKWFDITEPDWQEKLQRTVRKWYNK